MLLDNTVQDGARGIVIRRCTDGGTVEDHELFVCYVVGFLCFLGNASRLFGAWSRFLRFTASAVIGISPGVALV